MSWKPPPTSANRLRARLDDEFETVARPEGLRRTSDARREQAQDAEDDAKPAARKGPSLKMRAVGYLSRREHARGELARKLAAHAEDPAEVEAVLDSLEKEGWLSNERFAQGLVHRRAARQGTARIVQELRQHGVDDNQVAELRDQLRATEYERALEVWKKRFQARPQDRAAYAKQARFLASRGFAHDVIRRILGEGDED